MRTKLYVFTILILSVAGSGITAAFMLSNNAEASIPAQAKTSCCPYGDCCPDGACLAAVSAKTAAKPSGCTAVTKKTAAASCCPDGDCCLDGDCCAAAKAVK